MRVAFAGTPEFAARALEALVAAGHSIPIVLTQPDRPAGRGLRLAPSAVATMASRHGLAIAKPESLKKGEGVAPLRDAAPDVLVVAAYGLILPPAVLALPSRGCLNIHASLLPRWRGAAPIQRAILAGDEVTGVSIMQMDAGLDTGPVLLEQTLEIAPRETTGSLHDRLAAAGASLIVQALDRLDTLQRVPQDDSKATYAAKVLKPEARIDWTRTAREIDRQVRAFDPAPGAEARLGDEPVKVWAAFPVEGAGSPGEVLPAPAGELRVACGKGALRLDLLQRSGGRRQPAADFLRGHPIAAGAALS